MTVTDRDGMVPGDLVRVEKVYPPEHTLLGRTSAMVCVTNRVSMFLGCGDGWIMTHPVDGAGVAQILYWHDNPCRRLVPAGKYKTRKKERKVA